MMPATPVSRRRMRACITRDVSVADHRIRPRMRPRRSPTSRRVRNSPAPSSDRAPQCGRRHSPRMRAIVTALMELLSHPMRIFALTGTGSAARTTAVATRTVRTILEEGATSVLANDLVYRASEIKIDKVRTHPIDHGARRFCQPSGLRPNNWTPTGRSSS